MRIQYPRNYIFLHFEPSSSKHKKYDAILMNRKTLRTKKVPFGDKRYQQYKDSTPLKLYKDLDHGDPERR